MQLAREQTEPGTDFSAHPQRPSKVVRRILDPDNVRQLGETRHRRIRHVDRRAAWNVVDDDRQVDGILHTLVMLEQPFLSRLVVIGADDQCRIGACRLGLSRQPDRVLSGICPGTGDDRHPALCHFDTQLDHPLMFVLTEGGRFSGRTARHQAVGALSNLPSHQLLKSPLIHVSVAEWRDQRDERSLEHRILRDCSITVAR